MGITLRTPGRRSPVTAALSSLVTQEQKMLALIWAPPLGNTGSTDCPCVSSTPANTERTFTLPGQSPITYAASYGLSSDPSIRIAEPRAGSSHLQLDV